MKKSKRLLFALGLGFFMLPMLIGCNGNQTEPNPDPIPKPEQTLKTKRVVNFSPIGGFYTSKQTVTITAESDEEFKPKSIYYTTLKQTYDENGNWDEVAWQKAVAESKPTVDSTKYTAPFELEEDTIVRVLVVGEDGTEHYGMSVFTFDLNESNNTDSQVPVNPISDDWQDQTIYFILTDRFWNGDTTNDKLAGLKDQNGNDYDETVVLGGQPASGYQGGDIQGVIDKLDYIQGMGFTAIWLTPPVKCQIAESNYHGFHGYWASDMTKVDPHMGSAESDEASLKVYQEFVKEAHKRGMYVIQDIVVNHFGDYQKICTGSSTNGDGEILSKDLVDYVDEEGKTSLPSDMFYLEPKSVPFNHPEQLPWALNNVNDLTPDELDFYSFYHYNSGINNFNDLENVYTHSCSDLDDMKTEDPVVRNLLRGYFRYWIDKVGLDGYRIDTAKYVEPEFFEDFINCTDSNNMGVREYGISKGKKDFINFGEAWDSSETLVGSYSWDKATKTPRMDGMIYFPLRFTLTDAISSGGKTCNLSTTLKNRFSKGYYANPARLVTFVDNHDTDRWGQTMKGNIELQKAAYNLIYTIPGVPQVYYGSEQGFSGQCRQAMFEGGFEDEGTTNKRDYFDTDTDGNEWYAYFKNLNKMRADYPVFRRNTLYMLQDTSDTAGVFAYIVRQTSDNTCKTPLSEFEAGQKAIFVMNTASTDKILDAKYVGLKPGDKFELIPYEYVNAAPAAGTQFVPEFTAKASGSYGEIKVTIPANSTAIYILTEVGAVDTNTYANLEVTSLPEEEISGSEITLKGKSDTTGKVKIVLNGDLTLAESIDVTANEEFEKVIDVTSYSNGTISVQLVQEVEDVTSYSSKSSFTILRPFKLVASYTDPIGDDNGVGVAKGKLLLPKNTGWHGQFDIAGYDVYRSGNDVRIGIKMKSISRSWAPTSNLFDHVVMYVFISDGDNEGCEYHSRNNYKLPETFGKWDYMFQCNGWGQSYYKSAGAAENTLGNAITPSANNSPAVDWVGLGVLANDPDVTDVDLDWSDYNPQIGDEWEDKPGMIWITISAGAMGYPKSIDGYKFFIDDYDFDMGSPRGMVEGEAEEWKFGTGDLKLEETPRVVDEGDEVIVIPSSN